MRDGTGARRSDDPGGFTLLELLVALTITGLVVSTVYLTISTALQSVERNRSAQERSRRDRNATALLTSLLRSTRMDLERAPSGFRAPEAPSSASGGDELIFASSLGAPIARLPEGERIRVHLWRGPGPEGAGELLLSLEPLARSGGADTLVLFSGVEALRTRFRASAGGAWAEAWNDRARLPAAVRLDLVGPRPRPPVVAALPLAGDSR